MFLFMVFLCGLLIPFLLVKFKTKWVKWIPAILFLVGAIIMGIKAWLFPGPDMAVLGEIMYFLILGAAALGSLIGGVIVGMLKK